MNNNKLSLLAISISFLSGSCFALQALDDDMMQDISGQGGITIEQTTTNPTGLVSSMTDIKYTQNDRMGNGEDEVTLRIDSIKNYEYKSDINGNFIGLNTSKRIIDIDKDGNLFIKTTDIDTLDTLQGAMYIGNNKINDGSDIRVWKFADGSFTELEARNDPAGAKIISRTNMKEGSGYTQIDYANGIATRTDVYYLPKAGSTEYVSELILTSHTRAGDGMKGLKLEFGTTAGTLEVRDLSLYEYTEDAEGNKVLGNNVFGAGTSYYTTGLGNINVTGGYMSIFASPDHNGLEGSIYSNVDIGSYYIATDNDRFNINDFKITTGIHNADGSYTADEIRYRMRLVDNGFTSGLEGEIFAPQTNPNEPRTTVDLTLGTMKFSDLDGSNETPSFASMAIHNLDGMGGQAEFAVRNSNMFGDAGTRQIINIDKASFDFKIAGNDVGIADSNLPVGEKPNREGWVEANVVVENMSIDQHVGNTKLGIMTVVEANSFDMSFNAIKAGNQETYKGQSGRLVLNNYSQMPGSYTRIEPLN